MGRKYILLSSRRTISGFSLLEILVSIVILSVGLLGVVGLQAAALKANREALLQSSASRFGREISEMMKSNRAIASLAAAADNPYLVSYNGASDDLDTVAAQTTNCFTGDCYTASGTAAQQVVAEWQIRDWLFRVNHELPGARVAVCFDETPYTTAGIPQWDCSDGGTVAVIKIGWTRSSLNSQAAAADAFDRASEPAIVLPVSF